LQMDLALFAKVESMANFFIRLHVWASSICLCNKKNFQRKFSIFIKFTWRTNLQYAFTCHSVVLPAITSSTAHHLPLRACHYSHSDLLTTAEASWNCDRTTVYPKSVTHKSVMSLKKTSTEELKQKHTDLTLKQRMKTCKKPEWGETYENPASARGFLCDLNIPFPVHTG
jgi:hypothetical protein